jgi:adenosine deaminase
VGIFQSPVSNEYLLAAQHFSLGRLDLIRLTRRAIDSAFGGEAERNKVKRLLSEFETETLDTVGLAIKYDDTHS